LILPDPIVVLMMASVWDYPSQNPLLNCMVEGLVQRRGGVEPALQ